MKYLLCIGLALLAYSFRAGAQLVTPEKAYVATNGTVVLSCPADSTSWLRSHRTQDLLPVTSDEDGVILRGDKLIIEGFQSSKQAGSYYCIATINNVTLVSCPAEIVHARIQASPFAVDPADTVVAVNSTAVLTCTPPYSQPSPTVLWKKNGEDLNLTDSRNTVLATGNLYITSAQFTDAGEYQCTAHNEITGAKRRSTIATLTVSSADFLTPTAPNITITPDSLSKSTGDVAIFECIASGHPSPIIQWEKLQSTVFPHTAKVLSSGALVIDPVTSEEGGVYRCLAHNSEGEVFSDVRLDIKGSPGFTQEPPAAIAVGETPSALSWGIQDTGPVKALLFHNGVLLESISSSDGSLSLSHSLSIGTETKGTYQCLALGDYGCTQSTVTVTMPSRSTTATATEESTTTELNTSSTPELSTSTTAETTSTTELAMPTTDELTSTTELAMPTTANTTTAKPPVGTAPTTSTPNETTPTPELATPTTTTTPRPPVESTTTTRPLMETTEIVTTTDTPREMLFVHPVSVELDGPVELVCVGTVAAVAPVVTWYDPTGNVLPSSSEMGDESGVNATLVVVDKPGRYVCEVTWGTIVKREAVTVTPAPLGVLVGESVTVTEGETVELVCGGEGSGVSVEWRRASGASLREEVVVSSTRRGYIVTVTYLLLEATVGDEDDYVCVVSSPYFNYELDATVKLTVRDLPIGPPHNIDIIVPLSGGLILSWEAPETDATILGYKINYGNSERPPALVALDNTAAWKRSVFVRPDVFLKFGEAVTVVVWAYSARVEGEVLSVVVSPRGLVVPTEPPILLGSPILLSIDPLTSGGVLLSWEAPETDETILGYKINYGNSKHPPALVALDSTAAWKRSVFVRPDVFLEFGEAVTVVVWAYSARVEGEVLSVVVNAVRRPVGSCAVDSTPITPTLTFSPQSLATLTLTCTEAQVTHTVNITAAETNMMIPLEGLLPSCGYSFQLSSTDDSLFTSCSYNTPNKPLNISGSVHRHSNGSVELRWIMPVALRNQPSLVVELDWGRGPISVVSGQHLPLTFDPYQNEFVVLRFRLHDWTAFASIFVPPLPTDAATTTSDPVATFDRETELALLYGVIFGAVVVLCGVIVMVILVLKYVQSSRRENDKVSDEKEKERDYFRRMSMERVSVSSVKRSAQSLDSKASGSTMETDI